MPFKNTLLPVAELLQSKGKLADLRRPQIMGIINNTPDSFFAGSRKSSAQALTDTAGTMIAEGAAILDLGGYSTRPGAVSVAIEEETERVIFAVETIRKHFPDVWISADTFRSTVAASALAAGADVINDISGGTFDPEMLGVVARAGCPYIAMHLQGTKETMHASRGEGPIVERVLRELSERCATYRDAGIKAIVLDPGFGFSKSLEENYALLNGLDALRILGKPLLVGISRKSMICKKLNIQAEEALNATTALHMAALRQGASLLRVHDVRAAAECLAMFEALS